LCNENEGAGAEALIGTTPVTAQIVLETSAGVRRMAEHGAKNAPETGKSVETAGRGQQGGCRVPVGAGLDRLADRWEFVSQKSGLAERGLICLRFDQDGLGRKRANGCGNEREREREREFRALDAELT
jgi:hypothetical protein